MNSYDNDMYEKIKKDGQENIKKGIEALKELGINIPLEKDIPLYSVDPNNPNVIIQNLNGIITVGTVVDGQFKPKGN